MDQKERMLSGLPYKAWMDGLKEERYENRKKVFFFANYNLTVLDVGKVKIGKNAQIAPNVSIYTAGHPIHPDSRNSGYEYGIAITIGDNVWIGGNVCILPGVNIGNDVVIGAGSVVTKDLPDNVIAAGNPCRIVRDITDDDRDYYYKNLKFDVDDYITEQE
ncbi:MAG: sugar O-acetyltransferase [Lachnospiraceae bacterium]|nr:sugar O-acetyltransferase [Lachnospiraceae bacterium]